MNELRFTSTDLDRNDWNDLPFIQTRNDRNGIISLKNTRFTAIRNTRARVTSRSDLGKPSQHLVGWKTLESRERDLN